MFSQTFLFFRPIKLFFIPFIILLLTACPFIDDSENEGEEGEIITEISTGLNANAGIDQTVDGGTTVFLDGTASTDDENTIVSYQWEQLSNLAITLENTNSATASFEAVTPTLTASLTGVFQLTVTNSAGDTDTDIVDITILRPDEPLIAQASNQTVLEQTTVNLNGSSSFDNDNTITAFEWVQTSGEPVSLNNANTSIADFLSPSVSDGQTVTLEFQLTVTNDADMQDSTDVTITVTADNNDLVADGGSDQLVTEGDTVTLDGSASYDPDDTITNYSWKQSSGETVIFNSTDTTNGIFTFIAPEVNTTETLVFELTVTNSNLQNASDSVTINISDASVSENTTVYFGVANNFNEHNLWRSDGTSENTQRVADVILYNDATNNPIFTIGDYSYFEGYDSTNGRELWRSDGTTANTVLVPSAPDSNYNNGAAASANPTLFDVINDKLIYSAFTSSDNNLINYGSLLAYDPVTDSLATLFNDLPDSYYYQRSGGYNSQFYFSNITYNPNQSTLYVTDTSNTATAEISHNTINPHGGFNDLNGELLFIASDQSLYKFDGSNYNQIKFFANRFTDISVGDGWETHVYNGDLYFAADDDTGTGHELWKTDGTPTGTILVKDIDDSSASSQPHEFHIVNNRLIFFVDKTNNNNVHGVWTTDGSDAGTEQIANLKVLDQTLWYDGHYDAKPVTIDALGLTFFVAQTDDEGIELWATDGTASGTYLVKDINTGTNHSYPALLRNGGNILIFSAIDDELGCANLWKSDGTESGTTLVKEMTEDGDFCVGNSPFYPLAG